MNESRSDHNCMALESVDKVYHFFLLLQRDLRKHR
jgi:hypothetical protein